MTNTKGGRFLQSHSRSRLANFYDVSEEDVHHGIDCLIAFGNPSTCLLLNLIGKQSKQYQHQAQL